MGKLTLDWRERKGMDEMFEAMRLYYDILLGSDARASVSFGGAANVVEFSPMSPRGK